MNFKAEFFKGNRRRLLESISDGLVVIPGNGQLQRSGDTAYPFRQDSNFWYLAGINEPDLILVFAADKEFIILPKRSAIQEVFDGSYDKKEISEVSGIDKVLEYDKGWDSLKKIVEKSKVYTPIVEEQNLNHSIFINHAKTKVLSELDGLCGQENLKDISKKLTKLRMIKQQPEIEAIQESIDVTIQAFKSIMSDNWAKRYKNESDINTEFLYAFSKESAVPAYPSIIASGINACTLHYVKNNQAISMTKPLLIDAGAEKSMYTADITRVYFPEKPTPKQKAIYSAVKSANRLAVKMVKPGVYLRDIELAVEKRLGDFLYKNKFIESQERKFIRKFYPHAVSHHLGLDVHDTADYDNPLEAGNVITIEPGLYLPDEEVGIRLEDDILVTKTGSKNLSADLPC